MPTVVQMPPLLCLWYLWPTKSHLLSLVKILLPLSFVASTACPLSRWLQRVLRSCFLFSLPEKVLKLGGWESQEKVGWELITFLSFCFYSLLSDTPISSLFLFCLLLWFVFWYLSTVFHLASLPTSPPANAYSLLFPFFSVTFLIYSCSLLFSSCFSFSYFHLLYHISTTFSFCFLHCCLLSLSFPRHRAHFSSKINSLDNAWLCLSTLTDCHAE